MGERWREVVWKIVLIRDEGVGLLLLSLPRTTSRFRIIPTKPHASFLSFREVMGGHVLSFYFHHLMCGGIIYTPVLIEPKVRLQTPARVK